MATERVRKTENIGPWLVMTEGPIVMAQSHLFGEPPGQFMDDSPNDWTIVLPYEVAKGWGPSPIGNWYGPGDYGGIVVGFIRPTSHRDLGVVWPEPRKLPLQIILAYER